MAKVLKNLKTGLVWEVAEEYAERHLKSGDFEEVKEQPKKKAEPKSTKK